MVYIRYSDATDSHRAGPIDSLKVKLADPYYKLILSGSIVDERLPKIL